MRKLAIGFGTRSEAKKLTPLIQRIQHEAESIQLGVCVKAQHREMLREELALFGINRTRTSNSAQISHFPIRVPLF